LTGPQQFAAQVAAVVGLVEATANYRKATTVAKEAIPIKYSNKTSHSITKFLESPFAGKHPKPIQKCTEVAAAEAAVTAADATAVNVRVWGFVSGDMRVWNVFSFTTAAADFEKTKRLAAEFEALGGGALTMALAQETGPGTPCARAGSHTSGSACRRPVRSIARKS
jgi:hypothetical protein